MKYIKQIILIVALLAVIMLCFAFSVSAEDASSVLETEEMTLSFVLDGVAYTYSCSSDATWDDLNGAYFYVGDDQAFLTIIDGGVFWQIAKQDGMVYDYWLVSGSAEDSTLSLVTSDDPLIFDEPYSTQIELVLSLDDEEYSFYFPSYIRKFEELIQFADGDYNHPELGRCLWSTFPYSVFSESNVVSLQLLDVDGAPTYCLRSGSLLRYVGNSLHPGLGITYTATDHYDLCITCSSHVCETIITKEPTCTEYGESISVCTICGVKTATISIPWTDHEFTEIKRQPATCVESGYIVYQCFNCGNETFDYLAALEHTYNSYTTVKEPTCTEVGYSAAVCSDCGNEDQKELAALGHDYGLWNCFRCGSIRVVDWIDGDGDGTLRGPGSSGSSDNNSGADPDEGGGNDSNFWSNVGDWLSEQGNKIRDALGSGKDDFKKLGDSLLTLVVAVLLIPVIVLLFSLFKAIMKGVTFGVNTLVDLFKALTAAVSRIGKKGDKK